MSRQTIKINENTTIYQGIDHALGKFIQVTDKRFEKESEEGEGYVLDYDDLFGFSVNLINAKTDDLSSFEKMVELTNNFILEKKLKWNS